MVYYNGEESKQRRRFLSIGGMSDTGSLFLGTRLSQLNRISGIHTTFDKL